MNLTRFELEELNSRSTKFIKIEPGKPLQFTDKINIPQFGEPRSAYVYKRTGVRWQDYIVCGMHPETQEELFMHNITERDFISICDKMDIGITFFDIYTEYWKLLLPS